MIERHKKMMKMQISAAWAALFALILSGASLGEEVNVKIMSCYSGTVKMIAADENMMVFGWEDMAIDRDISGQQHPDSSEHCIVTNLVMGGETKAHGYCKVLDPSGDYMIMEVSSEHETTGNWKLLYGTGRFAGATGQGTYRRVTSARPIKEGTYQGCNEVDGVLTLKDSG